MFTGIVEEVGRIITADRKGNSARLKIEAEKVLEDIKIGDSIAVNGICLSDIFREKLFYRRCDARNAAVVIDWRSSGGKSGEPGTCDGGKQQIWRSYRDRTY